MSAGTGGQSEDGTLQVKSRPSRDCHREGPCLIPRGLDSSRTVAAGQVAPGSVRVDPRVCNFSLGERATTRCIAIPEGSRPKALHPQGQPAGGWCGCTSQRRSLPCHAKGTGEEL